MPTYFFHLAFELYPTPHPTPQTHTESHAQTHTHAQPHARTRTEAPTAEAAAAEGEEEEERPFLPPPGTDIFAPALLPVHRVTSWAAPVVRTKRTRRERERNKTGTADESGVCDQVEQSRKPITPRDWRFDRVSIQSIDMEARGADGSGAGEKRASSGLATKGKFVPADPKNTEVGWGVVHLYRDAQETPGLYDDTASSTGSEAGAPGNEAFSEEDCTTLCILAVPSYMTPSDLLGFVGEQTREDVSHFRLIRTGRANKYMVLMKFREAKKARQWRKEWNGKLFNSMEPENCHVVFVKSIEFQTSDANRDPSSFPNMTNDPFTPAARPAPTAPLPASSSETSTQIATSLSAKPLAPPTPSLVELPTCPVCLERMDETTGLLTILCQHVFHCACLEKWRGSGCPVCRYTQADSLAARGGYGADGTGAENECSVCGTTANLWICLICGNTGCGRYDAAHAFRHYETTAHSYAMDIATQHVWDYAGDGYVHRLIQTKADGKLVDLPAAHQTAAGAATAASATQHPNAGLAGVPAESVPREKLDNMASEYAYLLTSQLDSQRAYFEEQVERAADKAAQASAAADKAAASAERLAAQVRELQDGRARAETALAELEREHARVAARAGKADELARGLARQVREEKSVSDSLMERIRFLEGRVREGEVRVEVLEGEKRELEEVNRDLGFFISGGEKLRELQGGGDSTGGGDGGGGGGGGGGVGLGVTSEEIVEGRVEVPVPPPPPAAGEEKGRRKKGKGRK
ncbi:uncharacterized protein K452DRAFT_258291 [Aplosporella prunicola CBS 121167]|uniref:RING-10 protein n=1 Tax=Aplosporella prunicola CBS 121167 TaxID=1176127 RepID=A0A6A6AZ02_9PEZI|nr:uncharacterized protein K452DRAFT_258291 [Aplosporella prunicola CBS 121167]KAF2137010.1 hypothetical protein K452DRAFT_258291 [Aplosporella prunicola CBS 121167]